MELERVDPLVARRRDKLVQDARELHKEARREEFFRFFVASKMLSRFQDDLAEVGFTSDEEEVILASTARASFEDVYRGLSYPHDLRDRYLGKLRDRVRSGELKPEVVFSEMVSIARKNGYSIGFHLSKFDIRESSKGWAVIGKEQDHRDNDLPMAYYAREFKWLYRRKLSNFLYVVRAEDDHRVSPDGRWWRAVSLSIVQQIPLDELQRELSNLERDMREHAAREGVVVDEEE